MKYVIYEDKRYGGKVYYTGKILKMNGKDVAEMKLINNPKLYSSFNWGMRIAITLNKKCKHQGPFFVEEYSRFVNYKIKHGGWL